MTRSVHLLQSVCVLDVLPHGARVRVALAAAGVPASIWLARDVCLLVFGTVARVVEPLGAADEVALVGLLPGVGPGVQLEVLQAREGPQARGHLTLVGLLPCVAAQVRDELVASVKGFELAGAVLPQTHKLRHGKCVGAVKVGDQTSEGGELLVALVPEAEGGKSPTGLPIAGFGLW